MRFFPAEPDISTVFNRIVDDDIDLQPDFQRGEVWPVTKQQRLVDTILRGWVIPPILIITPQLGMRQQVLDGQQRLAAIRDFKLNLFPVDGRIKPISTEIDSLHGLRFEQLPDAVRKRFDRTTLRMYEVADYSPEEPAEIFFRLNQPTALTSAEKRNAFFGPVRDQIRKLVDIFEKHLDANSSLGFTNSRMAYDDVFARVACTLELGTLQRKITATGVNEMYRRQTPLSAYAHSRLRKSVRLASKVFASREIIDLDRAIKLNKATLYSWLLFFCRLDHHPDPDYIASFIVKFELARTMSQGSFGYRGQFSHGDFADSNRPINSLLQIYSDRATSRVSDVSSVLVRDFSIWAFWYQSGSYRLAEITKDSHESIVEYLSLRSKKIDEASILNLLSEWTWGSDV